LTRRIDRLLIDQQGIDYPAHLDELLPISTVAGKARYFAGRHRSDLPETDLGHHPLEPSASNGAGRRATEIVVNDFDLAPAQVAKPISHRILQYPAFLIVRHLVS